MVWLPHTWCAVWSRRAKIGIHAVFDINEVNIVCYFYVYVRTRHYTLIRDLDGDAGFVEKIRKEQKNIYLK